MQPEFWQKRWALNQIGFHLPQVNPYLQRFWPGLELAPGAQVLVPLCGKSLDLAWLAGQGFKVMGIELTEKAVEDFFSEQQLAATIRQHGPFKVYSVESIELWCGDFFALTAADVAECAGLYDRAALIALPPQMRESYTGHLAQILPLTCQGLLITLDYEQSQIEGPPFAVPDAEVQQRLAADWQIQVLETCDVLSMSTRFLNGGATRLEERAYRLRRGAVL
ncbi:thiopurine S-methyltransferase [Pseudomonas sp. CCI3.2]|uniref:thiopurine S-methyltransferase n=1 Tax=unclassified Pseudomonas TaxID=196821 RepID=UPI002AC8CD8A|nr:MULTISPECIES: thiopurine S-methyltransferase [unclassified Pseudomonas]MEB0075986.1 thiopurine S-methyltransferase [Pseudomonas sp. MH10out]MEB0101431.1 thiopurine S-methyltransferase [Pseudomonas sp. CCI3.2]MEB0130965.1 thiopurine S-methyltransferase [Pseudomonas sp. CCI2.4]MEB0157943.1 thiopurine S-methyltransferase [Pseudomonas sp. AH2 (2023)]MEB0166352.1 thiopurine S-methyltransferase [Pseudomonas sp. CCC4.4]